MSGSPSLFDLAGTEEAEPTGTLRLLSLIGFLSDLLWCCITIQTAPKHRGRRTFCVTDQQAAVFLYICLILVFERIVHRGFQFYSRALRTCTVLLYSVGSPYWWRITHCTLFTLKAAVTLCRQAQLPPLVSLPSSHSPNPATTIRERAL